MATVASSGPAVMLALLRALLGPAGIARVHKAASALSHLASASSPPPDRPGAQPLLVLAWLATAARGLLERGELDQEEAQGLVDELGSALGALCREEGSSGEEGRGLLATPAGRSLKRCLRSFAERHQH